MLRAFQWDLARQVERLDHLLDLLPRYADWGYERLYLHLEDAVDYPSLPGVARTDAYPWHDFEKLVAAATARGIRVVPIGNLLGHTQYLIKTDAWRDLNELRDPATGAALPAGQICPLHSRTPELAEKLIGDLAPLCTAGEIHVGLDESFYLGKHPLSRAEIAEIGLAGHFARHVTRLHGIAASRGLRMGLWADMLALLPGAIPLLPQNAGLSAYDWYYHPFAQRPKMELYNFSEYEPTPALRAAGIAYWACPMNGAFRHEVAPVWGERLQNIASWWRRAQATRAAGFLVTSWEPYRLALGTTTLMDAAAATLWLEPERGDDPATLLAAGLRRFARPTSPDCVTKRVTQSGSIGLRGCGPKGGGGLSAATAGVLARGLLATDAQAFVGNSRWEINTRWDSVGPRRESPIPHSAAARRLARLAKNPALRAPSFTCLAATLRFQTYLATRDAFVRRASAGAARLRRLATKNVHPDRVTGWVTQLQGEALSFAESLRAARRDARAMWTCSRPAETFAVSQNAGVLAGDVLRLRAWRSWLRAVARRPAHAPRASPLLGRWTLRFTVHHFAPAWQKIVVEQQQPDGTWHELYGRVTIEFRARAARARPARLRMEFACPVDDPDAPLRIATRCVGQVAVSHIEITDGVTTRQHRPLRTHHVLGEPAPKDGWPKVDWARNTGELPLTW